MYILEPTEITLPLFTIAANGRFGFLQLVFELAYDYILDNKGTGVCYRTTYQGLEIGILPETLVTDRFPETSKKFRFFSV